MPYSCLQNIIVVISSNYEEKWSNNLIVFKFFPYIVSPIRTNGIIVNNRTHWILYKNIPKAVKNVNKFPMNVLLGYCIDKHAKSVIITIYEVNSI